MVSSKTHLTVNGKIEGEQHPQDKRVSKAEGINSKTETKVQK